LAERGFTLIEILIVVAIIGIAGSVIVLSGRSGPKRVLEAEADRLLQILSVARDEAEVTGQPLALSFSPQGYSFQRRERNGRWQPVADDLLRARQWPVAVTSVRLEPDTLGNQLRFEPGGRALPFSLRIDALEQQVGIAGDALGRYRLLAAP
jgi:general secretion pathway protein H